MKKTFLFISPICLGEEHLMFELSFIYFFKKRYPDCDFKFLGQDCHCQKIQEYGKLEQSFKYYTFSGANRILLCMKMAFFVFFLKGELVILWSNYFVYFMFLFRPVFLCISHSFYLEYNKPFKYLYSIIFNFFLYLQVNVKIIFLGEWIFNSVQKNFVGFKYNSKVFLWMHHPYIDFSDTTSACRHNFISPTFGILGRIASPYKKSNLAGYDLLEKTISSFGGTFIKPRQDVFIEYSQYLQYLREFDYLIILSDRNAYKYRCSGIFIEAIMNNKPIICLDNFMANYYFSRFGNIGYICKSIEEVLATIDYILNKGGYISDFQTQKVNLLNTSNIIYHETESFFSCNFS